MITHKEIKEKDAIAALKVHGEWTFAEAVKKRLTLGVDLAVCQRELRESIAEVRRLEGDLKLARLEVTYAGEELEELCAKVEEAAMSAIFLSPAEKEDSYTQTNDPRGRVVVASPRLRDVLLCSPRFILGENP